jgi:hypothetical protein
VGAEPGNKVDPTGMYVCEANKSQCSVISASIKEATRARDTYRRGSAEYRRIDAAINAYGREGQKNGVVVKAGELSAGTLGEVGEDKSGNIVATFDFRQLHSASREASSFSSGPSVYAGIVGHEGKHVWQHQNGSARSRSSSIVGRREMEIPAYRTQLHIMEGLGLRASHIDKERFVNEGADRSALSCTIPGSACND